MTPVIHIAGLDVTVGTKVRQRCAWCGATLEDRDLAREMVPVDQAHLPRGRWEPGALVAVDGHIRWVIEPVDGDKLPDGSCALIDDSVTT